MTNVLPRLAVVEAKIEDLEAEMDRTRERLHDHASALQAIKLLAQTVSTIEGTIESVAVRAADKAVAGAFSSRAQITDRTWRFRISLLGSGVAIGALIVSLIELFTR